MSCGRVVGECIDFCKGRLDKTELVSGTPRSTARMVQKVYDERT